MYHKHNLERKLHHHPIGPKRKNIFKSADLFIQLASLLAGYP